MWFMTMDLVKVRACTLLQARKFMQVRPIVYSAVHFGLARRPTCLCMLSAWVHTMVDQEVNQAQQPDFTLKTDPVSACDLFYIQILECITFNQNLYVLRRNFYIEFSWKYKINMFYVFVIIINTRLIILFLDNGIKISRLIIWLIICLVSRMNKNHMIVLYYKPF